MLLKIQFIIFLLISVPTDKMMNIVNCEMSVDSETRIVVTTDNNVENFIPWNVSSLEEFLFYFCPECDVRIHSKETFVSHALNQHPKNTKTHNTELCECYAIFFFFYPSAALLSCRPLGVPAKCAYPRARRRHPGRW